MYRNNFQYFFSFVWKWNHRLAVRCLSIDTMFNVIVKCWQSTWNVLSSLKRMEWQAIESRIVSNHVHSPGEIFLSHIYAHDSSCWRCYMVTSGQWTWGKVSFLGLSVTERGLTRWINKKIFHLRPSMSVEHIWSDLSTMRVKYKQTLQM